MSRVTLIHWNAEEAKERLARLRRSGQRPGLLNPADGKDLHTLLEEPPDAFVIDLDRLPSQGRDLAVWLRQRKPTRRVPIVFVAGDPEKVAKVRKLLPDAVYARWNGIGNTIRRAIQNAPEDPVVRGAMDAYKGAPLTKKLRIRAGATVALLGAPPGFERTLGHLPRNVELRKQARGRSDVILLFVRTLAELKRRFPIAARALADGGALWLVWPKKASGIDTDLDQKVVRAFGLNADFVDYKISKIDDAWAGLCFTRRGS